MSVMDPIIDRILEIARAEDVPVVGTGPCTAMEDAPQGYRPSDLLPGARGMICFGVPVPHGVYQDGARTTEMVWRSQGLLYRRLDTISLEFAQVMEAHGARAVPVFGCSPMAVDARGRVVGYVNQLRMGELTGIGTIGRNGLLLHRRHGARLMLGGVLTTRDLPAGTFPDEKQPDCPPDCRVCIDACPARAIRGSTRRVNVMGCLAYTARTPFMSRLHFAFLSRVRPRAAARLLNLRAFDEHTMHICSRCVTACPYGGQ